MIKMMTTMLKPAATKAEAERTGNRYYLAINPCIKAGHIPAVYYRTSRGCVACALERRFKEPRPIVAEVETIKDPARDVLRAAGWR